MRAARRRTGLLERVSRRERIDLKTIVDDPRDGRERLEVDLEQPRAHRLADDADVADRRALADAKPPGPLIARQVTFERGQSFAYPMADPLRARRLVELQFVGEIIAYARHHQR